MLALSFISIQAASSSSTADSAAKPVAEDSKNKLHKWAAVWSARLPCAAIKSLALSNNGGLYLAPAFSKIISKIDTKSGSIAQTKECKSDNNITALAANSEQLFFSQGHEVCAISAYDLSDSEKKFEYDTGHKNQITSLALSANRLYSGSTDQTIGVWNVTTEKWIAQLVEGWCEIKKVIVDKDGKRVISAAASQITVWDTDSKEVIKRARVATNHITDIAFLTDNKLCVAYADVIDVIDLRTYKKLTEFKGHTDDVTSIAVCEDSEPLLFSGSMDGTVRIWDVNSSSEIGAISGTRISKLQFDSASNTLYAGSVGGDLSAIRPVPDSNPKDSSYCLLS